MLAFAIILVYDTFPKMSTSKIPFIDNSILQPKRLQAKAKISLLLHAAADVALHVPLGNILALIVMLLAARRSVLDLRRLVPCLYASPVPPVRGAKRHAGRGMSSICAHRAPVRGAKRYADRVVENQFP